VHVPSREWLIAVAALVTGLAVVAPAGAAPIAYLPPAPTLPAFTGAAATATPVPGTVRPPLNRFLARGPWSNIHNDAWMTDAYHWRGPLGVDPVTASGAGKLGVCGTIAFDSRGRIVTVCPSTLSGPQARIVDPDSLDVLATYDLPDAPSVDGSPGFQDFAAGGYFFLDAQDRIWIATKTNHILVIGQTPSGDDFVVRRDIDLTNRLDVNRERMTSVLRDFRGRLWFVTKQTGKVGTYDLRSGATRILDLPGEIQNSFALDRNAVYVATNRSLYRLGTFRNGTPKVIWGSRYRNTGITKPGQADAGTGTTPTVLRGGLVAITDNADPMNVVVYRTSARLRRGVARRVCQVPVFSKGASATENSLIGAGRSIIVENNYGYTDPFAAGGSAVVSAPGFARVDVRKNGRGCRKVWTNTTARAPSAVPKLSIRNGLIYTYTRPPDPGGSNAYYWTAIDFRSGRTRWNQYAGHGTFYNNNYAGIALGPDGGAYLGVIGGIISLRDGP
jgi:hypothetical protein